MSDLEKNSKKTVSPISVSECKDIDEFLSNLRKQLPEDTDESVFESLKEVYGNLDLSQVGQPTVVKINSDSNEVKVVYQDDQNKNKEKKES